MYKYCWIRILKWNYVYIYICSQCIRFRKTKKQRNWGFEDDDDKNNWKKVPLGFLFFFESFIESSYLSRVRIIKLDCSYLY